jgi:peptide/nickel transport system permease protein
MVFQGYTLFPWLTVKKNVMFGLEVNNTGRTEAEAQARQWLHTWLQPWRVETLDGQREGLITGYFKGWFDTIVMRLLEAISAIPAIIIALLAIAAIDGQSPVLTVLIIAFVFTPNIARTVRAAVLAEAEYEYVAAARLRTERTPHILFKEILPNVMPPIIVEFTVRLGYAIFAIATLSFLGAGVEYGSPNWGTQISENWALIFNNQWWPTAFPAIAIASLAVSVNLISDGLLEVFEI